MFSESEVATCKNLQPESQCSAHPERDLREGWVGCSSDRRDSGSSKDTLYCSESLCQKECMWQLTACTELTREGGVIE